jgi:hypothetical protein
VDSIPTSFSIGTAIHLAFAAHVAGLDPREIVQDYLLKRERAVLERSAIAGVSNTELMGKLAESRNEVIDIISHYYSYWGWGNPLERQGLRYIAAEVPLRVPIPNTIDGYLVGTLDGIAIDEFDNYWLIEHKTYSSKPDRSFMETNDQMTAYCWLFSQVFGFQPTGVLYDGVAKKLPGVPRLLNNGAMSKQWIDTTAPMYVRCLLEAGLNPDEYIDFIARLEERDSQDQNPFFTRWKIYIPHASIDSFSAYLPQEYFEMNTINNIEQSVPLPDLNKWGYSFLYPNYRWEGCWDCRVKDLCKAIQFKEDVSYIIDNFYSVSEGHETYKALKINPGDLSSPMDLIGYIPNILIAEGYL